MLLITLSAVDSKCKIRNVINSAISSRQQMLDKEFINSAIGSR